jgi:alcohol dehydrogenase
LGNDFGCLPFGAGTPGKLEASVGSVATSPFLDYRLRTRIVQGAGAISQLGGLASELGATRVLVVSDPGVVMAGHTSTGMQSLSASGLQVALFDGARENPTTADVQAGVELARQFGPDLLVGLGGGSSMDCAKGINFLLTNGGKMSDYWGVDKASQPMLPLIAVPTTAGTGSEMQSFALISDAETHVKMACGDKKTCARVAILDPELTWTQPAGVTALTGIDAISHAVETFVTKKRNPVSQMYSREAFRLLSGAVERVLVSPADEAARADMQLGASFAGLAIESSMLGAAHALANPLTARFGTAHGQAVGLMLPHVVRFNAEEFAPDYSELMMSFAGSPCERTSQEEPAHECLAGWLQAMLRLAGLQVRLSDLGVTFDDIDDLAAAAVPQWTGTFNPRPVDAASLAEMYRLAM